MKRGRQSEETLNNLRERVRNNGGFTVLYDGETAGRYIIGVRGFTVNAEDFKLRHINQISVVATITPGVDGYGAWNDDGIVYLDAIRTENDKSAALALARHYNQLAIFDSVTGSSIYLHLTDAG